MSKRKPIPKSIREEVYFKYGGCCAYCGTEIEYKDMQVNHSILKDKNGQVYLDELAPDRGNMNTEIFPDCGIMCYLSLN